jgi:hypothetical protein
MDATQGASVIVIKILIFAYYLSIPVNKTGTTTEISSGPPQLHLQEGKIQATSLNRTQHLWGRSWVYGYQS